MNIDKIMEVMAKGFTLVEALRQAAETAAPALKAMMDLVEKAKTDGSVSDEELAEVEAVLDQQLDIFNRPIDPG